MDSITDDISLKDLADKEWLQLSNRSINICKSAGLISLNRILDFYSKKGSFLTIRNCGAKTDNELIEICEKYSTLILNDEVLNEPKERFLNIMDLLNPFQKATLNRHFEYLLSNLNVRAYNGLVSIHESLNPREVIETIFSERFDFNNIRNIGNKTVKELENFKLELISFVNLIQSIQKDKLSKEYSKLILKSRFSNLPGNFEEQFENVLDESGKIKLFTLLNFLINSNQLFSAIQQKVFNLTYKLNNENNNLDLIATALKISRERVRQVKSKLEEEIQNYFLFVSNFISDDLVYYNIRESNSFLTIDNSYIIKINDDENVNFNTKFYSIILGILLIKTHVILGDNDLIYGKRKTVNQKKFKNCYLIEKQLFNYLDFESFVKDIYLKVNEKKSESYSLQFQGYLYSFLKVNCTTFSDEVFSVCKEIILREFDLFVDSSGYINFERTTKKQVYEYCSEVLEEVLEPMSIDQIAESISNKFADFNPNIDSLRRCLNREKTIFINFSRTGTYGLRKWENEKDYLKGGTIRDIVHEFLAINNAPKHITEILAYVHQYRPLTNEKSVMTNIRIEENNKFCFYNGDFVGLQTKHYAPNEIDFKKIIGSHFRRIKFEIMDGWHFDEIVKHYVKIYGYKPVQIQFLIKKKISEGELKFTQDNILKI